MDAELIHPVESGEMVNRVLVVDDEEQMRKSLASIFTEAAFDVRIADDGDIALSVYRKFRADVVVTDVIMPEVDGIEFIRALRSEFPDVPVIAISGGGGLEPLNYKPNALSTQAYLAAAQEAGANAVLAKPFAAEEILCLVQELCG